MATNLTQPKQSTKVVTPVVAPEDIRIDSRSVRNTILGISRTLFFIYSLVFLITIAVTLLYFFGRY